MNGSAGVPDDAAPDTGPVHGPPGDEWAEPEQAPVLVDADLAERSPFLDGQRDGAGRDDPPDERAVDAGVDDQRPGGDERNRGLAELGLDTGVHAPAHDGRKGAVAREAPGQKFREIGV